MIWACRAQTKTDDFDLNQIIDFQRQLVAMNEFVACEKVKVTAGTIKNNYRAFKLSTTI